MKCDLCGEQPPAWHPEGVSSWECKCKGFTVHIVQRTEYEKDSYVESMDAMSRTVERR